MSAKKTNRGGRPTKSATGEKAEHRHPLWMTSLHKEYLDAQAVQRQMSKNEYLTELILLDRAGKVKWPGKPKE